MAAVEAAAADEPVTLRIVHQRRNMPALLYFEDIDDGENYVD